MIGEGEGTFYGPKIDLHMTDVLGRSWQMGTIQYDMQMPARFGHTGTGPDNREHMPLVVHRALYGSFERFIGILVEHFAGAFPFWLSPVQVRVIPVGEGHRAAAGALRSRIEADGYRVDRRARRNPRQADPRRGDREGAVRVVYGDRESDDALAVRERGGEQSTLSTDAPHPIRELAGEADPVVGCYDPPPASRSSSLPHLPGLTRGGSTEPVGRSDEPLRAAVRVVYKEEAESLMKGL